MFVVGESGSRAEKGKRKSVGYASSVTSRNVQNEKFSEMLCVVARDG